MVTKKRTSTTSTTPQQPARRAKASRPASPPEPRPARRMNKRELQAFRKRLSAELDKLTSQRDELEEATSLGAPEATGEVGFDEEWADAGSATFERERDMSLVGNVRDLIGKVERALARIEDGSYGRCEVCGNAIEPDRLEALPYATLCLADARRQVRLR